MDKKTTDIIFFLQYWDKKNPTLEDQTGFMLCEMDEEEESMKIGDKVYSNTDYYNVRAVLLPVPLSEALELPITVERANLQKPHAEYV